MAGLQPDLSDPDFENWVKAGLSLQYTKDGIENFVDTVIDNFHKSLPIGITCTNCTTDNIIKPKRKCPSNVCDKIRDEIIANHRYGKPAWQNTDARQWCTNRWKMAVCYMSSGYSLQTSVSETDLPGLISCVINNTYFQNYVAGNLSDDNNVFRKARTSRNDILHNPRQRLTHAELLAHIATFTAVLSDKKSLSTDTSAIAALTKLQQMSNNTISITTQHAGQILADAFNSIKGAVCDVKDLKEITIKDITDARDSVLNAIKGTNVEVTDNIKKTGEEMLKPITDAKDNALVAIKGTNVEVTENIKKTGKEMLKPITDAKDNALDAIKETNVEVTENIKKTGVEALKPIADAKDKALNKIEKRTSGLTVQVEKASIAGFFAVIVSILAFVAALYFKVPVTSVDEKLLKIMTSAIVFSFVLAVLLYIKARTGPKDHLAPGATKEVLDLLTKIESRLPDSKQNAKAEIKCVDMIIVIESETETCRVKAEDTILSAIKQAGENSTEQISAAYSVIREIVNEDGRTIIGFKKGSIILTIKCISLKGLHRLLQYVSSEDIKSHLKELSTATTESVGESINMNVHISEASVINACEDVVRILSNYIDNTLSLRMTTGIQAETKEQLQRMLNELQEEDVISQLRGLSQGLSTYLGKEITVDVIVPQTDDHVNKSAGNTAMDGELFPGMDIRQDGTEGQWEQGQTVGSSEDLPVYKRVLRNCFRKLVSDMDPLSIIDQFHEIEFLPYSTLRDITEISVTGYKNFKECLKKTKQAHLAEHLTEVENQQMQGAQTKQTPKPSQPMQQGQQVLQGLQQKLVSLYQTEPRFLTTPISPVIQRKNRNIKDLYVPPLMRTVDKETMKPDKDNKVNYIKDIFRDNSKNIYVVGNAGMGKSSLCKKIVSDWCDSKSENEPSDTLLTDQKYMQDNETSDTLLTNQKYMQDNETSDTLLTDQKYMQDNETSDTLLTNQKYMQDNETSDTLLTDQKYTQDNETSDTLLIDQKYMQDNETSDTLLTNQKYMQDNETSDTLLTDQKYMQDNETSVKLLTDQKYMQDNETSDNGSSDDTSNSWSSDETSSSVSENETSDTLLTDQKYMQDFSFVFFISLRDCNADLKLIDMIKHQLQEEICGFDDKTLISLLEKEKCLIVLDGLDEWTPNTSHDSCSPVIIPARKGVRNCSILTTTRPWKLEAIRLESSRIDKQIELLGIGEHSHKAFIRHMAEQMNPGINSYNFLSSFLKEVEKKKLNNFLSIPVILKQLVCIWNQSNELRETKTSVYSQMLNLLFEFAHSRLQDNANYKAIKSTETVSNVQLPKCFKEDKKCKEFGSLLYPLSKVAFETLLSDTPEMSLVFEISTTEVHGLTKEQLNICLDIGILSQTKYFLNYTEDHTKISFLHKTYQEFLAALWISLETNDENKQTNIQKFKNKCNTITSMFEFAEFLNFLSGMNSRIACELSAHTREITTQSDIIRKYRQSTDLSVDWSNKPEAEPVQELTISCIKEGWECSHSDCHLYLEDIILDTSWDRYEEEDIAIKDRLIKINKSNIKSLRVVRVDLQTHDNSLLEVCGLEQLWLIEVRDENIIQRLISESNNTLSTLVLEGGVFNNVGILHNTQCLTRLCLSNIQISHKVKLGVMSYLSQTRRMKEIKIFIIKCKDCGKLRPMEEDWDDCDPVLDLSQHDQLECLGLAGTNVAIDTVVNVTNMVKCDLINIKRVMSFVNGTKSLHNAPMLTDLHLYGTKTPEEAAAIVECISHQKHIKHLKLRHIDFGSSKLVVSPDYRNLEYIVLTKLTMTKRSFRGVIDSILGCNQAVDVEILWLYIKPVEDIEDILDIVRHSSRCQVRMDKDHKEGYIEWFYFKTIPRQ